MKEWWRLAASPSVRRRATRVALVVGTVLIAINHGDALLQGDLGLGRLLKIALTVAVPYLVSTYASVAALRETRPEIRCDAPLSSSSSPSPS
jgi:hypothetical protein